MEDISDLSFQDQLINAPPARSFSPSEDFIEMDFDPGSDVESESSGDSGQGRDGTDMEGDERYTDTIFLTVTKMYPGRREMRAVMKILVRHQLSPCPPPWCL